LENVCGQNVIMVFGLVELKYKEYMVYKDRFCYKIEHIEDMLNGEKYWKHLVNVREGWG